MGTGVNLLNEWVVKDALGDESRLPAIHKQILDDPQTSGGLLASLPARQAPELIGLLKEAGTPSAQIVGNVLEVSGTAGLVVR